MLPLRIVLDTNIVVSAAIRPEGLQERALGLSLTKPSRLYVSQPVLDEYIDVLSRPQLGIRKGVRARILQTLKDRTQFVTPAYRVDAAKDECDNIFLSARTRLVRITWLRVI